MRKLIIRSFLINMAGLTRQQTEQQFHELMEDYDPVNLPNDIKENYHIEDVWLPILNGDSKVEVIYPSKFEVDDLNLEDLDTLITKLQEIRNNKAWEN